MKKATHFHKNSSCGTLHKPLENNLLLFIAIRNSYNSYSDVFAIINSDSYIYNIYVHIYIIHNNN